MPYELGSGRHPRPKRPKRRVLVADVDLDVLHVSPCNSVFDRRLALLGPGEHLEDVDRDRAALDVD